MLYTPGPYGVVEKSSQISSRLKEDFGKVIKESKTVVKTNAFFEYLSTTSMISTTFATHSFVPEIRILLKKSSGF